MGARIKTHSEVQACCFLHLEIFTCVYPELTLRGGYINISDALSASRWKVIWPDAVKGFLLSVVVAGNGSNTKLIAEMLTMDFLGT